MINVIVKRYSREGILLIRDFFEGKVLAAWGNAVVRNIHTDDFGSRAKQGASTWDRAAFYFLLVLEVVGSIGSLDDAAFDFSAFVVKLGFLLPHAEVFDEQVMDF